MGWHGSNASFFRHKQYLDAILNGQREFIYDKPESFAKRIRGAIKNVRDRQLSGYESIYNATVKVTPTGIKIDMAEESYLRKTRVMKFETVYDILMGLKAEVKNTDFIFQGENYLTLDEVSMLDEYCKNSNLVFVHYDRNNKKLRICTNDRD